MRKLVLVVSAVAASLLMVASSFAADLKPGDSTSCNNASSITFEATGTSSGSDSDHGTANAVVWKSSNFTTIPITLGPNEHQNFEGYEGAHKVGISNKFLMGRKSVTLTSQPEFSRGDSIGDISGEVRITNTGTVDMSVKCN